MAGASGRGGCEGDISLLVAVRCVWIAPAHGARRRGWSVWLAGHRRARPLDGKELYACTPDHRAGAHAGARSDRHRGPLTSCARTPRTARPAAGKLQARVREAASAAIAAGAELDAIAQAHRTGQTRARQELSSDLLRRVERAARRSPRLWVTEDRAQRTRACGGRAVDVKTGHRAREARAMLRFQRRAQVAVVWTDPAQIRSGRCVTSWSASMMHGVRRRPKELHACPPDD
jgi:hypothetical protein